MRAKIHSREPDQNRDGETDEADAPACKNQNTKKRGRGRDVAGGKRVVFRTKTRAAPAELRFHRWTSSWNRAFDHGAGNACDRHRHQHRQKNSHPFFALAPPGDSQKDQSKDKMRGPITIETDVAHEIAHYGVLMLRDEITYRVVEIESRCDRYRRDDDADQPIKNGGALHK